VRTGENFTQPTSPLATDERPFEAINRRTLNHRLGLAVFTMRTNLKKSFALS
jgi:hypothetical protein